MANIFDDYFREDEDEKDLLPSQKAAREQKESSQNIFDTYFERPEYEQPKKQVVEQVQEQPQEKPSLLDRGKKFVSGVADLFKKKELDENQPITTVNEEPQTPEELYLNVVKADKTISPEIENTKNRMVEAYLPLVKEDPSLLFETPTRGGVQFSDPKAMMQNAREVLEADDDTLRERIREKLESHSYQILNINRFGTQKKTDEIKDLEKQYRNQVKTKELYNEIIVQGSNDGDFREAIKEGFSVPFATTIKNIGDLVDLYRASQKNARGEPLTDGEKAVLEKAAAQDIENMLDPKGGGYVIGKILTEAPAFIGEYGLTKFISTGVSGAVKGIPVVQKIASKSPFVAKLIGGLAGATAQTATGFAPRVFEKTLEYSTNDIEYVYSEDGEILISSLEEQQPLNEAITQNLPKGFASTWLEVTSESAGEGVQYLQKGIMTKFFAKHADEGVEATSKLAQKIGWNGILGEIFEEEIIAPPQALLEGEEYKAPLLTQEGTERLLLETIGIGILGTVIEVPTNAYQKAQYNAAKQQMYEQADELGIDRSQVDEVIKEFQDAAAEEVGKPVEEAVPPVEEVTPAEVEQAPQEEPTPEEEIRRDIKRVEDALEQGIKSIKTNPTLDNVIETTRPEDVFQEYQNEIKPAVDILEDPAEGTIRMFATVGDLTQEDIDSGNFSKVDWMADSLEGGYQYRVDPKEGFVVADVPVEMATLADGARGEFGYYRVGGGLTPDYIQYAKPKTVEVEEEVDTQVGIEATRSVREAVESYAAGEAEVKKLEELQMVVDAQEDPKRFKDLSDRMEAVEVGNRAVVRRIAEETGASESAVINALSNYLDREPRTLKNFFDNLEIVKPKETKPKRVTKTAQKKDETEKPKTKTKKLGSKTYKILPETEALIKQSAEMGKKAFEEGGSPAIAQNKEAMTLLEGLERSEDRQAVMKAYNDAWQEASSEAAFAAIEEKYPVKVTEVVEEAPVEKKPVTKNKAPSDQVAVEKAHKLIAPKKSTLPILGYTAVLNGNAIVSDLETVYTKPTDLEDGGYKYVGKQFVKTEDKAFMDENYPSMEVMKTGDKEAIAKVNNAELADVLAKASNFTEKDDIRPVFTTVQLSPVNGRLEVAASDGFRLFISSISGDIKTKDPILLGNPKKVSGLLDVTAGDNVSIDVYGGENIAIGNENGEVLQKTIGGTFPQFRQIIPSEINDSYTIDKKSLQDALKKIKPVLQKNQPVILEFEDGGVFLTHDPITEGRAVIENKISLVAKKARMEVDPKTYEGMLIMPVRTENENVIGVQATFLESMLKNIDTDNFMMGIKDTTSPIVIRDTTASLDGYTTKTPKKTPKRPPVASNAYIRTPSLLEAVKNSDRQKTVINQFNGNYWFGEFKSPAEIRERLGMSALPPIEFPEIVEITKELFDTPSVKKIRNKGLGGFVGGYFRSKGDGSITMNVEAFKDAEEMSMILAHELGHGTDYLPDKTMARGNILGRIASLRNYARDTFTDLETEQEVDELKKRALELQNARRELKDDEGNITNKDEYTRLGKELTPVNKKIEKLKKSAKYKNPEILTELKNITQLWRPFPEELTDIQVANLAANLKITEQQAREVWDSHVKYRYSSKELYADAISALFNMPDVLENVAPKFYTGFFEGLDQKPEVKDKFFEIWNRLSEGGDAKYLARQKTIRDSFQRGEDIYKTLILEKRNRDREYTFRLKYELVDKNQRVIDLRNKAIKEGKTINPDLDPVYALEESNYLGGIVKNYLEDYIQPIYKDIQESGLTWEDLGEVLFLERVSKERGDIVNPIGLIREKDPMLYESISDRLPEGIENKSTTDQLKFLQDEFGDTVSLDTGMSLFEELTQLFPKGIANPFGMTTKAAEEQLDFKKNQLGQEKWDRLQKNLENFREAVNYVNKEAERERFWRPELIKQIKTNPAYATFQVLDYLDMYIPASIKQQVGTLKDIANPADATVAKLTSVIRAIERNKIKRKVMGFMLENYGEEVQEAKYTFNGKARFPIPPKDPKLGLFTVIEDGSVKGFYVDKYVAQTMEASSTGEMNAILQVFRMVNSKVFRPLFITYNVGFQSFNLFRDFFRFYKNIPNMTLPRALRSYAKALKPSARRAWNIPDDVIKEMEKSKILGVTYNDIIAGATDEDARIDVMIAKAGVTPLKSKKYPAILKPIQAILETIERTGNLIESLPKVAAYQELNGTMPDAKLASKIRTQVGSPDFLRKGASYRWYNEVFLFSNAIKEGIRSDIDVATNPETRMGWWVKTIKLNMIPKLLMWAALMGLFGDKLKEMMEDASEYDKTNYIIIPIGEDETGKTLYMRVPQDESGRLVSGILWKALRASNNNRPIMQDITDLLSFTGGQLPSLAPSITTPFAVSQYLAGQNPYDFFRGRNVIPDQEFQAGGKYAFKPFANWMLQQMGLNAIMRGYVSEQAPETKTWIQKVTETPVMSNIVGRWIKVSDYGQTEKNRQIVKNVEQENAQRLLEERRKLEDAVKEYQSGNQSIVRKNKIIDDLVRDIVGEPPYVKERKAKATNIKKKFNIAIVKGTSDATITSLIYANTNAEKIALLREIRQDMSIADFNALRRRLIDEKIVSVEVFRDLDNER